MLVKENIQDVYPLSPTQEGIYFHAVLDKSSPYYFIQMSYPLYGPVQPALVERSFNALLSRYDALRAVFVHKNTPKPVQVILKERKVDFHYEDLTGRPDGEAYLPDFKERDRKRLFDLGKDVLMRVALFKVAEDVFEFVWSHHHIVMDGWCLGILAREFFELYTSYAGGRACQLPPVKPYRTYLAWLQGVDQAQAGQYWRDYLAGYDEVARLPLAAAARPQAAGGAQGLYRHAFSGAATAERLAGLAQKHKVTLNHVMQALWGVLLAKYNQRHDVVFGAVVSGRPPELDGVDGMVGLFINTVPVRVRCEPGMTLAQLLGQLRDDAVAGAPYNYHPLPEIQAQSPLKGGLFESILVFQNFPITEVVKGGATGNLSIGPVQAYEPANYALAVRVQLQPRLTIEFLYNQDLYTPEAVARVAGQMDFLVQQILENETTEPAALTLLTPAGEAELMAWGQGQQTDWPVNTLVALFERQVQRRPQATALLFQHKAYSYAQLDTQASQLAAFLTSELGVQKGQVVGLLLDKSPRLLIGLLAVLKAGAAYLPIDPAYPQERIEYLFADSQAPVLLIDSAQMGLVEAFEGSVFAMDLQLEDLPSLEQMPPPAGPQPEDLAYLIYTSGSTGQPKGVKVSHQAIANTLQWRTRYYGLDEEKVHLQLFSFSFDGSLTDAFSCLVSGGTLLMPPLGMKTALSELASLIEQHGVSHLIAIPSFYKLLLTQAPSLASLQGVTLAGEALPQELLTEHYRLLPACKLYNEYGPTENAVCSTAALLKAGEPVSIGYPVANCQVWLLDGQLRRLPAGVKGEICLSGAGLAQGYWGREALTQEKFVANPYGEGRLYRTGDLGYWDGQGRLRYAGRGDGQVKVRGYRIELGEVEKAVGALPGVADCRVTARQRATDTQLVAYVVAGEKPDVDKMRARLAAQLPEYMIPAFFVPLASLPLTANGKVDVKALPDPETTAARNGGNTPPRTDAERKVAALWREILGAAQVFVEDDFFNVGGHSLKAVQFTSALHKEMGVKLELEDFFANATLGGLARLVESMHQTPYEAIPAAPRQEYYELSRAQQRMWIADQFDGEKLFYNNLDAYLFTGPVDREALGRAFDALVERHESLRTVFVAVDGQPRQQVLPPGPDRFSLGYVSLPGIAPDDPLVAQLVQQEALTAVDLRNGPLIRAQLIQLAADQHVFTLAIHHIVSDGWSMEVTVREVVALYNAFRRGRPNPLPPLPIQYKDFAAWQNGQLAGDAFAGHRAYWLDQFATPVPVLNLKTDFPRPAVKTNRRIDFTLTLGEPASAGLLALSRSSGASLYVVMLTVLKVLFYRYTRTEDLVIGSVVAGRNHKDLEDQIGLFVNTLALRTRVAPGDTFAQVLDKVQATALNGMKHQEYPFDLVVEDAGHPRDPARNPLFDVGFTWNDKARNPGESQPGFVIEDVPVDAKVSLTDVWFMGSEEGGNIRLITAYNPDLFRAATIEALAAHLEAIVRQVTADPAIELRAITLGTEPAAAPRAKKLFADLNL